MLKNKIVAIFLSTLALSGCGFEPIYDIKGGKENPQSFKLNITGSNEQAYTTYKLRREIETLLPTIQQKTPHTLAVKIVVSETYGNIAYNANAKAQRSQGQLNAKISVLDQGLTPIHEATLNSITSYTVDFTEEFSNISAEAGARERLIKNLAQDIVHELSLVEIPGKVILS
jgi:hypothetical protein